MCKITCWKNCCSQWRVWFRPIVITVYILFVIIIVPTLIVNSVRDGFSRKDQLILIGGLFVLTAIPMSVWHISQHIIHFTKPQLQKPIIRVLWMVPIYASNAWFGLLFPEYSFYIDGVREIYEAYVIYNFMVYMLNYLNLQMDLGANLEFQAPVHHTFPLCCLAPIIMSREFIHKCKHGILQYAVVRPIVTVISIICELCDVYGEGSISPNVAFPYIMFINNLSQFVAMYCLVLFYRANKTELKPMNPVPKFLCIKAVIFFSFFQGVVITFLVYFGYIKNIFGSEEGSDYKILSSKLQDFLICIEMFFAALAHQYSYPHRPFHRNTPDGNNGLTYNAFRAMWDVSDIREDIFEHFSVVCSSVSRRVLGRGSTAETSHLIPSGSSGSGYQSEYKINTRPSTYGAVASGHEHQHNDGINIVKQTVTKDYSPQFGAPKTTSYFQPTSSSSSSTRNDKSNSNTTNTSRSETFMEIPIGMRKSDSTASDFGLNTPIDECGINVRGMEKDSYILKYPNA
ncbi:transmembrane protein 184C [Bradysia coprophila]|uniref:transmembrane protein 184C n=1 Tax=Bradysia coprophila TaxID=38358 RepID=UPI00187DCA53|nr:transmembrane protein 184C [Bradysia coprophila]XP_037050564.1 transmembrane protein 184C [Bradysia coprophila]